ncbi:MAG: phosphopeptide-binding protein [Deltaproteobacteria bacterium]|nr:MAG: phosphopeptide-binding protein [Deltaproteobacteria bacterium]
MPPRRLHTVTTCPACGKHNQLHYKYCLGCGAELGSAGPSTQKPGRAKSIPTPTPGLDFSDDVTRSGRGPHIQPQEPPPERDAALPFVVCTSCGAHNDVHHKFCSSCGIQLKRTTQPGRGTSRTRLTALNPDGSEGTVFPLGGQTTKVGREAGGILAADPFLSPSHASFTPQDDGVTVQDENSLNGVFRKLAVDQRYPLHPGQVFRIGQELIRFEALESKGPDAEGIEAMGAPLEGYVGRIAMVLSRATTGTAFPVPETGLNLGRERGEVLFADDGYVSGLHCRISYEDAQAYLADLGSSNGTFVRVNGAEKFLNGEVLLMGQQLFRITA